MAEKLPDTQLSHKAGACVVCSRRAYRMRETHPGHGVYFHIHDKCDPGLLTEADDADPTTKRPALAEDGANDREAADA